MKLGANILRRIVREIMAEAPDRTAEELDHLAKPRSDEARRLLAFVPTLESLPMEGAVREFVPAMRLVVENVALECEIDGDEGAKRREEVRIWLGELRKAVA